MLVNYRKKISKKSKKGFKGYPVASFAFYGPDETKATKLVVAITSYENASPEPMRKWFSDADLRKDEEILREAIEFIEQNSVKSVAMVDKIIGCPHEEGIDYPDGESCHLCPYWENKDRWS